jgi:hypothetical protein
VRSISSRPVTSAVDAHQPRRNVSGVQRTTSIGSASAERGHAVFKPAEGARSTVPILYKWDSG